MKKKYMKPSMQEVEFDRRPPLLTGSVESLKIENTDEWPMDDSSNPLQPW